MKNYREDINPVGELKAALKRAQLERDLYRARAIDEVEDHHLGTTHQTATFDVDAEVMRHMQGVL